MKETIVNILTTLIIGIFTFSYFYGAYQLFTNKHYSSKQLIGGIIVPPYAIYVGISDLLNKDKDELTTYEQCMNVKYKVAIKRLITEDELEQLEEAGATREEIIEVAKIRKKQQQKDFCQHLKI